VWVSGFAVSGEPLALAVVLPVCQTCSGDSARELTIVTNLNPYSTILMKGWGKGKVYETWVNRIRAVRGPQVR